MAKSDDSVHKDHRKRMRKRFLEQGFEGFADHEILEVILYYAIPRIDTNPLVHRILDEYKTLSNVFDASVKDLSKIEGLGEAGATLLTMIPSLSRLYESKLCENELLLHNTESIGQYALSLLKGQKNEKFALICVNSNRRVRWGGIILEGTIDQIDAYPRKIVSEVLKHNAKTVIFAHNHPNGSVMPSEADKNATRILVDVLKGIDVVTLDHIIVSQNRYYSMAEMGFIF